MLRLYLCEGDQPETGGKIEAYSGASITMYGHQAVMIGMRAIREIASAAGTLIYGTARR
jgi:hypothetical protein